MKHASLFSGIGGFDLAAEWMGWENVFHCEINPFCQKVLKYHFPNSKGYADIKSTDFSVHRGQIDILTGGFPCQPFSLAGKRKGTDDDRHLWPEMLRAITEIQPGWVVGENVYGFVNWDGGVVFEQVQTDLENAGYEVQAVILPACSVNAPHRRDRCWIIAHSKSIRLEKKNNRPTTKLPLFAKTSMGNDRHITAEWTDGQRNIGKLRRNDGIPNWMDRIKAYGNAIVPQVALKLFKAIEQLH